MVPRSRVAEAWNSRAAGETTADVAARLGMKRATLKRALTRARKAGWAAPKPTTTGRVTLGRCPTCGRQMTTRLGGIELRAAGAWDKRIHAEHAGRGRCRACAALEYRAPTGKRVTVQTRPLALAAPLPHLRPTAAPALPRPQSRRAMLREEWAHLQGMGVHVSEAARRLGTSEQTLRGLTL